MEPAPHPRPIHFYELDLLRFLAALAVVFYHYTFCASALDRVIEPFAIDAVTRYGWLGVEIFFLISGYVVLMSATGKTVKQFFLSRVTRLYPAFWVACTAVYVIARLTKPLVDVAPVSTYLLNMSMLQNFFGQPSISGVFWTLTLEIQFYFLIALLIGWGWLKHLPVVLAGWLGFVLWAGPAPDSTYPLFYLLFPRYAPFFISGMVFYLIQSRQGKPWFTYALLLVSFGLALRNLRQEAIQLHTFFETQPPFSFRVIGGFLSALYLVFWLIIKRKINLQRFPGLRTLGALTYPLYLIHDQFKLLFPLLAGLPPYVLLAATLGLALVAAWLLHVGIERLYRRKLGEKRGALLRNWGTA